VVERTELDPIPVGWVPDDERYHRGYKKLVCCPNFVCAAIAAQHLVWYCMAIKNKCLDRSLPLGSRRA